VRLVVILLVLILVVLLLGPAATLFGAVVLGSFAVPLTAIFLAIALAAWALVGAVEWYRQKNGNKNLRERHPDLMKFAQSEFAKHWAPYKFGWGGYTSTMSSGFPTSFGHFLEMTTGYESKECLKVARKLWLEQRVADGDELAQSALDLEYR